MKPFSFFFHYNKPAALKAGRVQVSIHFKNACHIVDNVDCRVPTMGRIKKTQPRFVMSGKASKVTFADGIAVIE